jgi:hypothetical protein
VTPTSAAAISFRVRAALTDWCIPISLRDVVSHDAPTLRQLCLLVLELLGAALQSVPQISRSEKVCRRSALVADDLDGDKSHLFSHS